MSADGWCKDESETAAMTNKAFEARRKDLEAGGIKEFCIPIHSDIITCTRDLPPNIPLTFRFTRSQDKFVIWSPLTNKTVVNTKDVPNQYRIILSDLRLTVKKVKVVDRIFNHYYNARGGKLPEIPFTRNLIRTYPTVANSTDLGRVNFVQNSQLPEVVCLPV